MGPDCRAEAPRIAIGGAEHVGVLDDSTIAHVRVTGTNPELAATLSKFIEVKPGDPVARATIADDIRRLWAVGVLTDVEVEAVPGHDGADLTFAVTPQPLIGKVEIGGDARNDLELRRIHALAGTPFEPHRVARMASAIEQSMIYEGYPDAKIHVTHTNVGLCVRAKRGPLVTIDKIIFDGRRDVDESALLMQLRSKGGINMHRGIYDEQMLSEDTLNIYNVYWEHGKAEVKIGSPKSERHGNHLDVTIPITEGATYRFGKITVGMFGGHPETLGVAPGELFRRSTVAKAIQNVEARLDPGDWVHAESKMDEQNRTVAITIVVEWRHAWDSLLQLPRR